MMYLLYRFLNWAAKYRYHLFGFTALMFMGLLKEHPNNIWYTIGYSVFMSYALKPLFEEHNV